MLKKRIMCWLLALLGTLAGGNLLAQPSNRIVAIVNNDIVTFLELEKTMKTMAPQISGGKQDEIRKQVLLNLVDQKLVDQVIKKAGLQVSKEEVEQTINRLRKEQGLEKAEAFKASLEREGLTEEEFRGKIREQIQRYKLVSREIGSKILISETVVREAYQKDKDKFQQPEGVHLAHILITVDPNSPEEASKQRLKAEEVLARLKKGEAFGDLARSYSQDPSASQGGDLGTFALEEIDPALREIVIQLKPGEVSPILQSPRGWQIIRLLEYKQKKELTYLEARDRIQERLFQEEVDKRFGEWIQKLRERSYIQILL
jgi:peptidyl-prolyl cis-trans isomerase SurA